MTNDTQKMGRLALRQEGNFWNAYYALPDSMEDAVFLGSISMVFVEKEERKQAFISLMREALGDLLEQKFGQRPTWPDGVEPAPESERSGHS